MPDPIQINPHYGEDDPPKSLGAARRQADGCMRCPLYEFGTQTVFGEGPLSARIMMVGEQPGDREDIEGHPFVGPAGRMLDAALEAAEIARGDVYVTNAVKHFKFQDRGKRRLHKKPNAGEIDACRWWLDHEIRFVRPGVVVALGATALRGLLGKAASVSSLRGEVAFLHDETPLIATVHPSYLLRMPDKDARARERELFVADLALARRHMEDAPARLSLAR